jgi:hypothetical protein
MTDSFRREGPDDTNTRRHSPERFPLAASTLAHAGEDAQQLAGNGRMRPADLGQRPAG